MMIVRVHRHNDASASCLSNDDGNEREARHTSERFKVHRAGVGLLSIVARINPCVITLDVRYQYDRVVI